MRGEGYLNQSAASGKKGGKVKDAGPALGG